MRWRRVVGSALWAGPGPLSRVCGWFLGLGEGPQVGPSVSPLAGVGREASGWLVLSRWVVVRYHGDVSFESGGLGVLSCTLWWLGVLRLCADATVCRAVVPRQPRCCVYCATTSLQGMRCCRYPSGSRFPIGVGGIPVSSHFIRDLRRATM